MYVFRQYAIEVVYNRHDEQVEMNSYIISGGGGGFRLQCITTGAVTIIMLYIMSQLQ